MKDFTKGAIWCAGVLVFGGIMHKCGQLKANRINIREWKRLNKEIDVMLNQAQRMVRENEAKKAKENERP